MVWEFPGNVRLRKKGAKTSNANANPANSANIGMRKASLLARLAGLAFASFHISDPSAVLCSRAGFMTKKRGETFVPPLSESRTRQLLVGEVDAHREVVGFDIAEIASSGIDTCNGSS